MADHKIFLPPQPLASLAAGISNDIGRNIDMEGRGEIRPHGSMYNENPIYAAFRFLDLDFLFQIILSLFAILFTYNAVNGEKERGTLRLIFSNSIPRDKYILGKVIGSYLGLAVPLLIPILLGCLILPLLGVPLTFDEWMRLGFILLAGYLFLGVFITLSVFISTLTKHSSSSFLFLLVIWIFAVLIIPRSSVLIAGSFTEVPSVDEINSKKNVYSKELQKDFMNKLNNFKPGNEGDMMQEFNKHMEEVNTEREEKMNIFRGKLNEERQNKLNSQAELALSISRISPASSFSLAASNLAGTSLDLGRSYQEQAKNYQKNYGDFQREKSGGSSGGGMMLMMIRDDGEPPSIDPSELPVFAFKQPRIASVFEESAIDLTILIIFNLLFFAGAFIRFNRFDLR
jgi:ABC-type transport system involved in multi-copper enzyme maturation permease subunit